MLLIIPLAYALEECQREQPIGQLPCQVHSVWRPVDCGAYPLTIYNESGNIAQTLNWSNSTPFCAFIFNITNVTSQTYIYNSSLETGAITVGEDSMIPIAAIILLPMLFAFLLLIGAINLNEEHGALKVTMFLLAPIFFWTSLHFGVLSIIQYYDFPALENILGTTVWWSGLLFFGIVSYFMIYFIYKAFQVAAQKKKERLEY